MNTTQAECQARTIQFPRLSLFHAPIDWQIWGFPFCNLIFLVFNVSLQITIHHSCNWFVGIPPILALLHPARLSWVVCFSIDGLGYGSVMDMFALGVGQLLESTMWLVGRLI